MYFNSNKPQGMKSKITFPVFLIFIFFSFFQKSNSQSFTSYKLNADSLLFDGAERNFPVNSACTGNVSMLKGCAKIIKPSGECGIPGSTSDASVGAKIEAGDKIQVCKQSIIEIQLPDGSIYRGGPGAEVNVDESMCEAQKSFSFRLLMGSMWNQVSHVIGGDTKYEVKTENAVVGSRGTKFLVRINRDTINSEGNSDIRITTLVVCLEGAVEVSNANGVTVVDAATQIKLTEDFQNGRITMEEFQRRVTEINNNNKRILEAGMELTVVNGEPPGQPVRTNYTLDNFSTENFSK